MPNGALDMHAREHSFIDSALTSTMLVTGYPAIDTSAAVSMTAICRFIGAPITAEATTTISQEMDVTRAGTVTVIVWAERSTARTVAEAALTEGMGR